MEHISEATADCFNALLQLRDHPGPLPPPDAIHERIRGLVDGLREKLRGGEITERDANEIVYAIAALADEIALGKPEPLRSFWMARPLQHLYFNEAVAGEGFFRRLEALRGDPRRTEALRVFYLCLLFGLQGRYAVQGGEAELFRLIESLRAELERRLDKSRELSPSAEPPDEPQIRRAGSNPALWAAMAVFAVAIGVFIGLKLSLGAKVSKLEERVAEIGQREK